MKGYDTIDDLTLCEQVMHKHLTTEGTLRWENLCGYDVATLNRLVKKGYAILSFQGDPNDKYNKYWSAK